MQHSLTVFYREIERGFFEVFFDFALRFYLECLDPDDPIVVDVQQSKLHHFDRKCNAVSYIENSARGEFLRRHDLCH